MRDILSKWEKQSIAEILGIKQEKPPEREFTASARSASLERAATWDDFKGNQMAVKRLRRTIKAARLKGTVLPNILLYGSAGCGKTTLAKIVAREWGAKLLEITGSSLRTQLDLVKLCYQTNELHNQGCDVIVFIDEIHGIVEGRGLTEDIWLPLIEDGRLMHGCMNMEYHDEKHGQVRVAHYPIITHDICWIGATTDPGLLAEAIRSRFKVTITLEQYSKSDIEEIVNQYCNRKQLDIDPEAAKIIADRARYRPRIALEHILSTAIDEAVLEVGHGQEMALQITIDNVLDACELMGIKKSGLRDEDIRVLKTLASNYPKGMGVKTISGVADLASNIVSEMCLPFLQAEGLVLTTHKRFLTEKGKIFTDNLDPLLTN